MHYLVKGHLLDWRGSFVGEKRKKNMEGSIMFDVDSLEGEK